MEHRQALRGGAAQHRLANEEFKDMLQYGHLELADQTMDPGYIQHNPNVPQGREGFKRFIGHLTGGRSEEIKPQWKFGPVLALADGPYVLMMWNVSDKDPADSTKTYTRNHFDVLRIEGGLEKEHWDESRIERTAVTVDAKVLTAYPGGLCADAEGHPCGYAGGWASGGAGDRAVEVSAGCGV